MSAKYPDISEQLPKVRSLLWYSLLGASRLTADKNYTGSKRWDDDFRLGLRGSSH